MHLYYPTPDGNTHYITAEQAREFLRCSRRTIDNYRRHPDTYGARLLRAHATGRLLPDDCGIWYCRKRRRVITHTGFTFELHELTQAPHWGSAQAATIANLKAQLTDKETEVMQLKRTLATLTAATLAACASQPKPADYPAHVAPLEHGRYSATATDTNPQTAEKAALIYARGQCADLGKQPAITEAKHDSNRPETTGAKWGTTLAQLGTALYAHNTNRTYIGPVYTYRTTLEFTCYPAE